MFCDRLRVCMFVTLSYRHIDDTLPATCALVLEQHRDEVSDESLHCDDVMNSFVGLACRIST